MKRLEQAIILGMDDGSVSAYNFARNRPECLFEGDGCFRDAGLRAAAVRRGVLYLAGAYNNMFYAVDLAKEALRSAPGWWAAIRLRWRSAAHMAMCAARIRILWKKSV